MHKQILCHAELSETTRTLMIELFMERTPCLGSSTLQFISALGATPHTFPKLQCSYGSTEIIESDHLTDIEGTKTQFRSQISCFKLTYRTATRFQ